MASQFLEGMVDGLKTPLALELDFLKFLDRMKSAGNKRYQMGYLTGNVEAFFGLMAAVGAIAYPISELANYILE